MGHQVFCENERLGKNEYTTVQTRKVFRVEVSDEEHQSDFGFLVVEQVVGQRERVTGTGAGRKGFVLVPQTKQTPWASPTADHFSHPLFLICTYHKCKYRVRGKKMVRVKKKKEGRHTMLSQVTQLQQYLYPSGQACSLQSHSGSSGI